MDGRSGCPRSLQVATFGEVGRTQGAPVRLPPQSPSRYIHRRAAHPGRRRPVAPAVSKSLHSTRCGWCARRRSGCPRSLQVATFLRRRDARGGRVRLPPQSPSRYILGGVGVGAVARPVAPAVSKSLHSTGADDVRVLLSGCPRSLQVATFRRRRWSRLSRVRLPPQSPSRYIRPARRRPPASSPVAPAVSKSLHSDPDGWTFGTWSGCPRSLQVATFVGGHEGLVGGVRLPPQSPSRYIQAGRNSLFGLNFLPLTEDRRTDTRPFGSNEPTTGSSLRSQVPPRGECRPSPTKPLSPSAHGRSRCVPRASARSPSRSRWQVQDPCFA